MKTDYKSRHFMACLGAVIASERELNKGWSQQELASATGLHPMAISKIERGVNGSTGAMTTVAIGTALGREAHELFRLTHDLMGIVDTFKISDEDVQSRHGMNLWAYLVGHCAKPILEHQVDGKVMTTAEFLDSFSKRRETAIPRKRAPKKRRA